VYIKEAHARDTWPMGPAVSIVDDPKTDEDRVQNALKMRAELGLELPLAVDTVEDQFLQAFAAWPERFFVIAEGKVAYISHPTRATMRPEEVFIWITMYEAAAAAAAAAAAQAKTKAEAEAAGAGASLSAPKQQQARRKRSSLGAAGQSIIGGGMMQSQSDTSTRASRMRAKPTQAKQRVKGPTRGGPMTEMELFQAHEDLLDLHSEYNCYQDMLREHLDDEWWEEEEEEEEE
jgi:hypothetical protein